MNPPTRACGTRCLLGAVVALGIVHVGAAVRAPTPAIPWQAGDGFQDVTAPAGIGFVHQFCHSRIANILLSNGAGAAVLDYDGDGWMDLYFLNWGPLEGVTDPNDAAPREPDRLYRNLGNGTFADVTASAGVAGRGFASAAAVGDIDNDEDEDLAMATGSAFTIEGTLPLLLLNDGRGRFTDGARAGGRAFGTKINARGAVTLDFDRDGRTDLLFTALADRPLLLRNRGPNTNHWLSLQLQGTRSNRIGYGALLTVEAGGRTHRREALCPIGFLSQGDPRPHFGLGAARQVDRLQIQWPSGTVQTLTNLTADQTLSVQEPSR